jgi:hypothetical protein
MELREHFTSIAKRVYTFTEEDLRREILALLRGMPIYKQPPPGMIVKAVSIEIQSSSRGDTKGIVITEEYEKDETPTGPR